MKTAEKFLIYKQKDFKGQEVNRMFVIREPWLDFPLFGEDNPLLDWVKDTMKNKTKTCRQRHKS